MWSPMPKGKENLFHLIGFFILFFKPFKKLSIDLLL